MNRENAIFKTLALGQSIWCDFLSRDLIRSGRLSGMIASGVRGVTTNPSIFENAIGNTSDYDSDILSMVKDGKTREQIYETLTAGDVTEAADLLAPLYRESGGADGFVSLEVSPLLAHDAAGTLEEARKLANLINRPNLMIKIPATGAGIEAVRQCAALGINVNVTLIFSRKQYRDSAGAYIDGLVQRAERDASVSGVASVASLFVSRVDTAADKMLEDTAAGGSLAGRIAVDNARAAYADFEKIFSGPRWEGLAAKGASVQRPLWASTGTKNPDYSPTLYVDSLIGPHTVNTVPPATLELFLKNGTPAHTVALEREAGAARLDELEKMGISLEKITDKLLEEGLLAFEKAYLSLLDTIEKKGRALAG